MRKLFLNLQIDTGLTVANEDEAIGKIGDFLSANADYFGHYDIEQCSEDDEFIEVGAVVANINNFSPFGGFW